MNLRLGFSREVLTLLLFRGFDSMQQRDTSLHGAKEVEDAMDQKLLKPMYLRLGVSREVLSLNFGDFDSMQPRDTSLHGAKELADTMDLKLSPTS